MGTFGRSFSRELGKNTGKFVSNKVFGDSWSTPYRSSVRIEQKQKIVETQKEIKKLEYDNSIKKIQLEQDFEKQKETSMIIEQIVSTNFADKTNEQIFQSLTELYSLSESTKNDQIKNASIEKIDAGLFMLRKKGAIDEVNFFESKFIEKTEKQKNEQKSKNKSLGIFLIILGVISFFISPLIGIFILLIGILFFFFNLIKSKFFS